MLIGCPPCGSSNPFSPGSLIRELSSIASYKKALLNFVQMKTKFISSLYHVMLPDWISKCNLFRAVATS